MVETSEVTVLDNGGNVTIVGSGDLDLTNSAKLRDALAQVAASVDEVTVDFRSAVFIDSAVLGYLARAGKTMLGRGKRLKISVVEGNHPQYVLKIAGFGELMDIQAEPVDDEAPV